MNKRLNNVVLENKTVVTYRRSVIQCARANICRAGIALYFGLGIPSLSNLIGLLVSKCNKNMIVSRWVDVLQVLEGNDRLAIQLCLRNEFGCIHEGFNLIVGIGREVEIRNL